MTSGIAFLIPTFQIDLLQMFPCRILYDQRYAPSK